MAQQPQAGNSNIKILSVAWYKVLPPKFGGQKAVALFNEHLAQIVSLECLCSKNNEAIEASYGIHPVLPVSKWQFINPFVWRRIYLFAKRKGITHLILEFPYHGIAGFLCKSLLGIKLVVNTHNIEYLRFKEQKKWWWRLLYYFEKWTLKKADAVSFKTVTDKNTAQVQFGLAEKKLEVIPYGVDKPTSFPKEQAQAIIRQRHSIKHFEKILLFAGTLDYAPNAEAVKAITKQVITLLRYSSLPFKILICGRNYFKEFQYLNKIEDSNLIIAGDVPDVDTYFKAADVFINPVLEGGGIQTKIADALSYHLNVVCFASKASGIEHATNKIFTAKDGDWNAFVSAIHQALEKTEETPQAFFKNYNWRTIAAKVYERIIAA